MSNNNDNSSSSSSSSASSQGSSSSSYVSNYGIELQWPAQIMTAASNNNKDQTSASVSWSSTLEAKAAAAAAAAQSQPIRTSNELLQHRLLEAGILYDVPVSLGQVAETCHKFVADLERTGCFHSVQVEIGNAPTTSTTDSSSLQQKQRSPQQQQQQQQLRVYLDEKKWYRLHLGAGLKTSDWTNSNSNSMFSSASTGSDVLQRATRVEASFGLRNLTGCLDQTDFQYTVDLKQTASFQATHERPLYTFLPANSSYSNLRHALLLLPRGSQWTCSSKIAVQTLDFEYMRSYKEFQRLASIRISNQHSIPPQAPSLCTSPEQSSQLHAMLLPPSTNQHQENNLYWGLEWNSMIRDIVPRRDATSNNNCHHPFAMQASPQVVAQAGSTVKHSITGLVRKPVPANSRGGVGGHGLIEMALPIQLLPGDGNNSVVKYHAGIQGRWPLSSNTAADDSHDDDNNNNNNLTLHGSFQAGFLQSWSGGGARKQQSSNTSSSPAVAVPHQQQPPTLSDRFYVGGPGQFRGFLPGGIGPRATKKSSSSSSSSLLTPGGDALGGDFYYTATAILSAPLILPTITSDSSSLSLLAWPFQCFGFCTMGTCIGNVLETPISSILKSSRLSVGVGVATTVGAAGGLPCIELTYAWPLRYGPHDARRNFQWAIGISID